MMAVPHAIILNSGGLRSLVATVLVRRETQKQRLTLLHVIDGRSNAKMRLAHTQQQAEQHRAGQVHELDVPHLYGHGHGRQPDGRPMGPAAQSQMLIAALGHAWLEQAERVVWPGSCNGDARAMADATERAELCDQLVALEGEPRPRLATPLLEMTDQQIVELGAQMQVDWTQAWTCLLTGEAPCHACPACRRRKAAFDKAGLVDPVEQSATAR